MFTKHFFLQEFFWFYGLKVFFFHFPKFTDLFDQKADLGKICGGGASTFKRSSWFQKSYGVYGWLEVFGFSFPSTENNSPGGNGRDKSGIFSKGGGLNNLEIPLFVFTPFWNTGYAPPPIPPMFTIQRWVSKKFYNKISSLVVVNKQDGGNGKIGELEAVVGTVLIASLMKIVSLKS